MIYLVDTNILLRFAFRSDPRHPIVRAAVSTLRSDGHRLQATSQNFVEFWNVATRPKEKNGFGLTSSQADKSLLLVERLFPLLPDAPNLYQQWRSLVVQFSVSGVQVHDARLVATMKTHGISYILTFNTSDFTRYAREGIIPVSPNSL